MRAELGKWLMDKAFVDMDNSLVVMSVIIATVSTLGFGLLLVNQKQKGI